MGKNVLAEKFNHWWGRALSFVEKQNSERSFIIFWVCLYTINYFFLLINFGGIYWDDWTIVGHDVEVFANMFEEAGGMPTYYLHVFLAFFKNSVFVYHGLTFIFYGLANYLLYQVVRCYCHYDAVSRVLSILMSIFPINYARVAIINFPYTFSFLMFAFALLFFTKREKYYCRIASYIFLLLSFWTQSLLFYFLCFLVITVLFDKKSSNNMWRLAIGRIDFFLLPFVFFCFKSKFYISSGVYSDYNRIKIEELFYSIVYSVQNLKYFLSYVLNERFLSFGIILISLPLSLLFGKRVEVFCLQLVKIPLFKLFFLFVGFYLAGVYPYLVVGKKPLFLGMASRHQLLLGGAGSLLLLVFFRSILYLRSKLLLSVILLSSMIAITTANVRNYLDQIRLWFKQDAISYYIVSLNANKIYVYDNAIPNGHFYRFYELTGAYRRDSRRTDKLILDYRVYSDEKKYWKPDRRFIDRLQYNISKYSEKSGVIVEKILVENGRGLTVRRIFKGLYWNLVNKNKYKMYLKKYFMVRTIARDKLL